MRCIKKNTRIQRVTEDEAAKLVEEGWDYCPRSEWKKSKAKTNRKMLKSKVHDRRIAFNSVAEEFKKGIKKGDLAL